MSDFATNAAIPDPAPVPAPPIWAHLYVLDKWAPLCGANVSALAHEAPQAYTALADLTFTDKGKKAAHTRFKEIADGIAVVCAVASDARSVTACALENILDSSESVSQLRFSIRLSRNGEFAPGELSLLDALLKTCIAAVRAVDWDTSSSEDKAVKRGKVVRTLLPQITEHCRSNVLDLFTKKSVGRDAFLAWAEWNSKTGKINISLPMSIPDTDRLEISAVLTSLCLCMTRISTNHQLSGAILAAATLSSSPSFLATIHALEFPPAATPYLHKVARYRTAADQIVSGLQYVLHQARSLPDSFQVTTVDRVSSLFSASEDDEPDSLDRYLRDHLGLTYASLLTGKAIATKDAWSSARSNKCLLFHAELRLALFYALNDDKYPINGYIGVSKRCCGLCDFVLKGLQKDASVGYSTEVTGSPHFFCVRTNHGGFPANWKFPRIDGLPTLLSARKLQQLQARLALIRQDLSLFLKSKVQAMVPHIRDSAANQRADESDDDEDAAFRKIVQEDDLREIMDSMS